MIKYVSVAEMIAIETEADRDGLTYELMMENAGKGLAELVHVTYSHNTNKSVLGLVGSGNNGGDTLVALEYLARWGWQASAYLVRPRPVDDPLVQRLRYSGGKIQPANDSIALEIMSSQIRAAAVVMDGVLGTGIRLPLSEAVAQALDAARKVLQEHPSIHVIAVDCPSGVDCDTGEAANECIPAEMTVSMAAAKRGLLKFPAYSFVGDLRFVGIGLGEDRRYPKAWEKIIRFLIDPAWVRNVLPRRPLDAHKGTFGTALVVAGSTNYTGAALLAGQAAYRTGAGLVTLALPQSLHTALAGHFPEATWLPLPEEGGSISERAAGLVLENLVRATAMLVGPGFGLHQSTSRFIEKLLAGNGGKALPPIVFDADGLKLLAGLSGWFHKLPGKAVLTPHPGEMQILTGMSIDEIQKSRIEVAERFSREWGHVLVLKGAFTVIADPDGRTAVIPVATPALARAGTGDVLAGIIVGLRAQGIPAFESAAAGAWIHAQASLSVTKKIGSTASILAGDLLGVIGEILRAVSNDFGI